MGELVISGLNDVVLDRLKRLATLHDRTVEAEAREILETVPAPPLTVAERLGLAERLRRIREMTPTDVEQTDSVDMLRAIRDERGGGH